MNIFPLLMSKNNQPIDGDTFGIWAFSDSHTPTNIGKLEAAVLDMDGEDWDIALNGGDTNDARDIATDEQGELIVSELDNFINHDISSVYSILGNEDQTNIEDPEDPHIIWKKYIDPLGVNPTFSKIINANRPYPFNVLVPGLTSYTSGYLEIGNMLIFLLGDRNDGDPPMGKYETTGTGNQVKRPSGGTSQAEWNEFTRLVEINTDKIILVVTHHPLYETTTGSGYGEFWDYLSQNPGYPYEGNPNFGDPIEARKNGYLAFIENADATPVIGSWMAKYGKYIDLWMHGHCHRKIGETWVGRTRREKKYGTTFLNISPINTRWHIFYADKLESKSNLLQINGNQMTIKTYIHSDPNAVLPKGFYDAEEFEIILKTPFINI